MTKRLDPEIRGDSPQAVALALMTIIARQEGRSLSDPSADGRDWVLETYRQCLDAVASRPSLSDALAKIAQSDTPDTMLALLTALKAT